jgi:hypothetical protein
VAQQTASPILQLDGLVTDTINVIKRPPKCGDCSGVMAVGFVFFGPKLSDLSDEDQPNRHSVEQERNDGDADEISIVAHELG